MDDTVGLVWVGRFKCKEAINRRVEVSPLNVAATLTNWFEEGVPWDRRRVACGG